jgi:hypothetical protein
MADRVADEVDGLHFERGDPAALARAIKRAATEPGLWKRLAGALPTPPSRSEMVEGFRRIYQASGEETPAVTGDADLVYEHAPSPALGNHKKLPNPRRTKARQRSTTPVMSQEA